MIGILYIIVSFGIGYLFNKFWLRSLYNGSERRSLTGIPVKMPLWIIHVPASYLVGTLLVTWATYLMAFLTRSTGNPMLWGNILTFLPVSAIMVKAFSNKEGVLRNGLESLFKAGRRAGKEFLHRDKLELLYSFSALVASTYLMFKTFYSKNGDIFIGPSVWSDFGPHLSVIRSFSWGDNFPTVYPHFSDGNIRYHFLFQFLAGNLEYLGLRLDWAFNLPSILSLTAFFMLLYGLSLSITGSRKVGILASVLFSFRSSFAIFTYMKELISNGDWNLFAKALKNTTFIGKTANENWGLWNQNVYVNQRHLAFSLGIMLLVILLVLPLFVEMVEALGPKAQNLSGKHNKKKGQSNSTRKDEPRVLNTDPKSRLAVFFIHKDAWVPENPKRAIIAGILLGLAGFWNGAVVIATLTVLFFLAIFSRHRLEYLIIAAEAVLLTTLQASFFIGNAGSTITPELYVGFLAETKNSLGSIFKYYIELLGLFPILILIGLITMKRPFKWLILAFSAPLVLATTLKLTPDINANHKFIIIAVFLLNIIVAFQLLQALKTGKLPMKLLAIVVTILLTITGVEDLVTLNNINDSRRMMKYSLEDPTSVWISRNTGPDEIFLTEMQVLNPVLLAGRKLFFGWPYYAWSAGYDTFRREAIYKAIYGGTDRDEVLRLVNENLIRYIVIDDENRNAKGYVLNEPLLQSISSKVYENKSKRLAIYRVN